MSELEIITNNAARDLVSFFDLPESIQEEFEYICNDEKYDHRFVQYRGDWYDVGDMMAINTRRESLPTGFEAWHGYQSDSFFSGILVRYADSNYDSVIIGRYFS